MQDEDEPRKHLTDQAGPGARDRIVALTEEERVMLHEFARQLRDHDVSNPVARAALDRAAEQLQRAAVAPPDQD